MTGAKRCEKSLIEDDDYFVCDDCIEPLVHRYKLTSLRAEVEEKIKHPYNYLTTKECLMHDYELQKSVKKMQEELSETRTLDARIRQLEEAVEWALDNWKEETLEDEGHGATWFFDELRRKAGMEGKEG